MAARPTTREQLRRSSTTPSRSARPNSSVTESWIEIPSQPSESSESEEHIITSGLRIVPRHPRRRRNSYNPGRHSPYSAASSHQVSSSEDEEEEGPDGEDVASYIAQLPLSSSGFTTSSADSDDEGSASEDDDLDTRTVFASAGPSNKGPATRQDHDDALRNSLSTVLTCAAAARGLPKSRERRASTHQVERGHVQGLQVVREEDLPSSNTAPAPATEQRTRRSSATSTSASASSTSRKSSPMSKKGRVRKMKEFGTANAGLLLAASCGVLVVLSVGGFVAGYFVGREVGRGEGWMGVGSGRVRRVAVQ